MDYEDFRRVQRLEKTSSSLVETEEDYVVSAGDYLTLLKSEDLEGIKARENFKKIVREIYERREQKIVHRALETIRTGEKDPSAMQEREKQLYEKIVSILHQGRVDLEKKLGEKPKKLSEKYGEKQENAQQETKKEGGKKEGAKKDAGERKVTIMKDIPEFISSKGKFGPYKKGEKTTLPEDVIKILVKKQYVEEDKQ